jgi:hypothetical protein
MEAVQNALLGSATALIAVVVVIAFAFAFVVAPLLAGGGFVAALVLHQALRRGSSERRG